MARRRWLRWSAGACALALGVLGAAGLALLGASHGWQRERLRAWLEAALAERLGARVQLDELRGPLYPELELVGLHVERGDGFALHAQRIAIRCRAACGWREGALDLEALELEGAQIALAPPPPSPSPQAPAAPRAASGSGTRASAPLHIGALRLDGVQLAFGGEPQTELELDGELLGAGLESAGIRLPGRGELRVRAHDTAVAGRALVRLDARLRLDGGALKIDPLDAQTDAGNVRAGQLSARVAERLAPGGALLAALSALSLRADVEHLDAAAWSGAEGLRSDLSGPIQLRAEPGASGWQDAELDLHGALHGSAARAPLDALEIEAQLRAGRWQLARAALTGSAIHLDAEGSGTLEGIERLRVRGDVPDLARLQHAALAEWPRAGRASFSADAAGRWSELSGELALRADALVIGAAPAGALVARAHARAGELQIDSLRFAAPGESLSISGRIDRARRADLVLEAHDLKLERIPPGLAGAPLRGRISGELALRGALEHPELRAALRAEALRAGSLASDRAALELRAADRVATGELTLDPPGTAELHARFALPYLSSPPAAEPAAAASHGLQRWALALFREPSAELRVQGRAIDLAQLGSWSGLALAQTNGTLSFDTRVRGAAQGPVLTGRGELAGVRSAAGRALGALGWAAAGPIGGTVSFEQIGPWSPEGPSLRVEVDLDVGPEKARWPSRFRGVVHHWLDWPRLGVEIEDLHASRGEQRIEIAGRLRGGEAAPLTLQASGIDVASLAPPGISGLLSAQLRAEGSLRAPDLSGALVCESPELAGARASRIAVEFGTRERRLVASGRLEAFGTLAARARLEAPGPLGAHSLAAVLADPTTRFELSSEQLDLRWLAPLFPQWLRGARGALRADLQASGAAGRPLLAGTLSLVDASARVPLLGQRIGPLQLAAHLENEALVLDELRIDPQEGGHARARGRLELQSLRPRSLSLRTDLDAFPLSRSEAARFSVDGWSDLQGPLDALVFSGKLSVREGSFRAPERGDAIWKEVRVLQTSTPDTTISEGAAEGTVFAGASGSLEISIPQSSWVRARGAELEVVGDLELRKQRGEPLRYYGELGSRRGSYQLGRRALSVERGSLQMGGRDRIDPLLDVLASAQVADYRVEVLLSGPLSNPVIEPRSDPPLPRGDVLALLLFGRPSADLEENRAAALSSVLAVLGTEFAVDDLRTRMARLLPFDTFSVEADEAGTGTRLEVGRYVGEGVFLSYGRNILGPEPGDAVQLEWRLTPSLRLQSETSVQGRAGADLIWRKDY